MSVRRDTSADAMAEALATMPRQSDRELRDALAEAAGVLRSVDAQIVKIPLPLRRRIAAALARAEAASR